MRLSFPALLLPIVLLAGHAAGCASTSTPTPTGPTAAAASPKSAKAEELYRSSAQARKAGEHDHALELLQRAWSLDPGSADIGRLLEDEYLVRGLEQYAHQDLPGAIRYWELALQVNPRSDRATGYLRDAREKLGNLEKMADEGP